MRRVVTVLAGIAATLLGLTQIGVIPIAPGPDLGFESENKVLSNQRVIVLSHEYGDLNGWVFLRLRCHDPREISAKISDGTPLKVAFAPGSPAWNVEISAVSEQRRQKFAWPSGLDVILFNPRGGMKDVSVQDWEVYTEKDGRDSRQKELRRNIWSGISLALLALVLVGVFFRQEAAPSERPRFTPEFCVVMVIQSVEGSTPEETEMFRSILHRVVLEGVDPRDALAAAAGGDRRVWFKVRRQYLDRMQHLIEELEEFKGEIS